MYYKVCHSVEMTERPHLSLLYAARFGWNRELTYL